MAPKKKAAVKKKPKKITGAETKKDLEPEEEKVPKVAPQK